MYAWIWRRLPFGLPGKLAGSVLLIASAVALLWYVVFPWAEPLLPFDDVQVTQDGGVGDPAGGGNPSLDGATGSPAPDSSSRSDGFEIPYDTERNNTPPPDR